MGTLADDLWGRLYPIFAARKNCESVWRAFADLPLSEAVRIDDEASRVIEEFFTEKLGVDATRVLVPLEPTETMIDAGLATTGSWLDIKGSGLTVAREKMRRRYMAMIQSD